MSSGLRTHVSHLISLLEKGVREERKGGREGYGYSLHLNGWRKLVVLLYSGDVHTHTHTRTHARTHAHTCVLNFYLLISSSLFIEHSISFFNVAITPQAEVIAESQSFYDQCACTTTVHHYNCYAYRS